MTLSQDKLAFCDNDCRFNWFLGQHWCINDENIDFFTIFMLGSMLILMSEPYRSGTFCHNAFMKESVSRKHEKEDMCYVVSMKVGHFVFLPPPNSSHPFSLPHSRTKTRVWRTDGKFPLCHSDGSSDCLKFICGFHPIICFSSVFFLFCFQTLLW